MAKEDYVQTNVILLCDKGVTPTPFIATPKMQNHHGITGATIRDNIPLLNILPFGVCTVTRTPCIPMMPTWENYPKSPYFIEGFQPLLLSSQARCKLGGTIKIYTSYQEVLAGNGDKPVSWKDTLLSLLNKSIGGALLGSQGIAMQLSGRGDFVEGVGSGFLKGIGSTFEGLYNMVVHPLDTLGGLATLAGTAVVGYSSPGIGGSPQERLQAFDGFFGTNLADVDAGVKQSLSETWDTLQHGSDFEQGEIVGQAIEFVAELAVGTKGTGALMKSAKGGSMGGKVAKFASLTDKFGDILKATGSKLKNWTLSKLKNPFKGIFGKKKSKKVPYNELGKKPPCFLQGTLISTVAGFKSIELVNERDRVIVFDFKTHTFVTKNVVDKFQNWAKTYFIINTNLGDSIKATGRHMFWIENELKWKIAKKLNVGDILKTPNGLVAVTDVIRMDNVEVDTFNLEIMDYHNYLVGLSGVLVHNQSKPSVYESTASKETKFYKITDPNGNVYVGQTTRDEDVRFKEHSREKGWTKEKGYKMEPIIDPNRPKDLTPYEARTWEKHYMEQERIRLEKEGKTILNKDESIISQKKYEDYADLHSPCR